MNPVELAAAPLREEEELVSAVRRGDEAAFGDIHSRYAPMLEAYCARLLGCPDEAQDAVQQTFLKAHQSLRRNGNEIALGPWLYTIARNESFTILRARQRRPVVPLDIDVGASQPGAAELAEAREDLRQTLADIRSLPTEQREALVQTTIDAAPGAEVAENLGCEPAKVKSLVFRARSRLSDLREAREMSCDEVKRQISEGSGGVLRQRVIREHIRGCESCAELAGRPRFRRKLAALPVVLWPLLTGRSLGLGGPVESAAASGGVEAASGMGAKAVTLAIAAVAAAGGVAANRAALNQDGGPLPPLREAAGPNRAPVAPPPAELFIEESSSPLAVVGASEFGDRHPTGIAADSRRGQTAAARGRAEDSGRRKASARKGGEKGSQPHRGAPPQPPGTPANPDDGVPPVTAQGNPPASAGAENAAGAAGRGAAAGTPGSPSKPNGNGAAKSKGPVSPAAAPPSPGPPGQAKAKGSPNSRHQRSTETAVGAETPVDEPDPVEPAEAEVEANESPPGHVKNGKATADPDTAE